MERARDGRWEGGFRPSLVLVSRHTILDTPACVDRVSHYVKVLAGDVADDENLAVVLNRDQFGVIDARRLSQLFAVGRELDSNRWESETGLPAERPAFAAVGVDDAMLVRLDTMLLASFAAVRGDGSRFLSATL